MIAETVVGSEVLDDWSSAWQECKDKGEKWGGRGKGGEKIEGLGLGLGLQESVLPSLQTC